MSSAINFSLFTIGCTVTLIFYIFVEKIQNMYYLCVVYGAVWFGLFLFATESPYFLFNKGRIIEAHGAFLKIAKVNDPGQTLFYDAKLTGILERAVKAKQQRDIVLKSGSDRHVIYSRIALLCLLFLNCAVGYYLSALVTQKISRFSIYVNGILMEVSEFAAYFTVVIFANKMQRKMMNLFSSTSLLSLSLILLLIEFAPSVKAHWLTNIIQTTFSVAIRFIIGMNFALLYNYTAELLPTGDRGKGFGIVGVFNKSGGVWASFFEDYSKRLNIHPMVFAGSFSIFAIFSSYKLPETLNKAVPE